MIKENNRSYKKKEPSFSCAYSSSNSAFQPELRKSRPLYSRLSELTISAIPTKVAVKWEYSGVSLSRMACLIFSEFLLFSLVFFFQRAFFRNSSENFSKFPRYLLRKSETAIVDPSRIFSSFESKPFLKKFCHIIHIFS